MNYLLDTNIVIKYDNFGKTSRNLFISAITIMEILKNLNKENFYERKETAQKIIDSKIKIFWSDPLYLMFYKDLKLENELNHNNHLKSWFEALIDAEIFDDILSIDDYIYLNSACESFDRFLLTCVCRSKFATRVTKGKEQIYSVSNLDTLKNKAPELSKELYIDSISEILKEFPKELSYSYLQKMYHQSKSKKFFLTLAKYCIQKDEVNGFEKIVSDTIELNNHERDHDSGFEATPSKRFIKKRHSISRNDGTDLAQILYMKNNFIFVTDDGPITPHFLKGGFEVLSYNDLLMNTSKI